MELKDLGFNDWFQERFGESQYLEYNLARVIVVNKDNYIIRNVEAEIPEEITGKIIYGAESNLDFPTVGDCVQVQYFDENTFAVIHEILPRKSLLKRKVAGKKTEYQLIASNIDIAFIVQSSDFDFNLRRLERYLTMVNESNVKPLILLNKRDLISPENLKQEILQIKSMNQNYAIIPFSNKTGEGLDEIQRIIKRGETYCLLGSSGVGKTTLLNRLIGEDIFATGAVREKDGKGKTYETNYSHFLLMVNAVWSAEAPFKRGVNLTNWLQTSSVRQIQFTKFTRQDFINIKSLGFDAIRAVDQKHTIIIGPAGWNSYNNLKYMPEYQDDNLIYTFHFYDPFIFTHQGVSWTDPSLVPLAGVPFHYDASRMPDCPPELENTWVKNSLANYKNEDTVEHLKELIDIAADFQTKRDVPLFCGEFGV